MKKPNHSEAYHTGYESHEQGANREDNPYPAGSWDADEWIAGWYAADRDLPE